MGACYSADVLHLVKNVIFDDSGRMALVVCQSRTQITVYIFRFEHQSRVLDIVVTSSNLAHTAIKSDHVAEVS
jgi:hypothetical protein